MERTEAVSPPNLPHANGPGANGGKRTAPLKTVEKALSILNFLAAFGGTVGVRELTGYLEIDKSSTHRLLTTLERHGYTARDPVTGKYQLGARLFDAGNIVFAHLNVRVAAHPHLERLAADSGDVVHLAVVNGDHCVYVDKVTGPEAIPTASQVGWRKPLYCTGVGKVLLAHLPEERANEVLSAPLLPLTPHTVTDAQALRWELADIRACGVGFDREEIELGLRCIAAPLRGADGQVIAAISVAGAAARFSGARLERVVSLVRNAAEAISRDLAARDPRHDQQSVL